ncbi:MAG: HD domain-containing protein [Candidatus Moraniibacteriota bacterium]
MDKVMAPQSLNIAFETAVRLLCEHLPVSTEQSRKPILFHDIRVGVYLYEHRYAPEIVLAGVLHDALEWSDITKEILREHFSDTVVTLVQVNTKDDTIVDKEEKTNELIQRCVQSGQPALIVKTADIIDSFKWYSSQNNVGELQYCLRNASAIFQWKPESFEDKIFDELRSWQEKV